MALGGLIVRALGGAAGSSIAYLIRRGLGALSDVRAGTITVRIYLSEHATVRIHNSARVRQTQ